MKKLVSLLLIATFVMSLLALSGCGKTEEAPTTPDTTTETPTEEPAAPSADGTVDIGIVLPTKEEPRWVQDEARFLDAIGSTEYSVEILFSQGDSGREMQNVQTLIAKGIKVLIITPQDGDAAAAAVQAAKAEGITVISYDRLVTNTDAVDYYITFNSISVGAA
ncbi:MAG: sugar ABC transporter substrate-binding protein, partial [Firmicutes bacterium HGW-Firmicutes-5]